MADKLEKMRIITPIPDNEQNWIVISEVPDKLIVYAMEFDGLGVLVRVDECENQPWLYYAERARIIKTESGHNRIVSSRKKYEMMAPKRDSRLLEEKTGNGSRKRVINPTL